MRKKLHRRAWDPLVAAVVLRPERVGKNFAWVGTGGKFNAIPGPGGGVEGGKKYI